LRKDFVPLFCSENSSKSRQTSGSVSESKMSILKGRYRYRFRCRPRQARTESKRARPADAPRRRNPKSAWGFRALSAMMPSITRMPSGCRPGARPAEVCPSTCAISSGERRTRGRQRIAGRSATQKPTSARQFAACPEFSPDVLPSLSDFLFCPRIETLIRRVRRS
jgi:hypothetical protein